MEIQLPKSETGGGIESDWYIVDHSTSAKPKDQMRLYGEYISAISIKTKELEEEIKKLIELRKEILITKGNADGAFEKATHAITKINYTEGLVYFGFFTLLAVVVTLCFGYFEFIQTSGKNEDYKYGISERINNQNNEIKDIKYNLLEKIDSQNEEIKELKNCLKTGAYGKCLNQI